MKRLSAILFSAFYILHSAFSQSVLTADGLAAFGTNTPAGGGGGGGGDTTTGLIGWWKLDDGSGSTAVDSSASGNNGTLVNSPIWTTGHINGALSFVSSSSQVVNTANATALGGLTKATLAGWINRSSTANKVAFGAGSVSAFDRFNIIWYTDGNIYVSCDNNSTTGFASCALSGTGLHHVALVFDGTQTGNARLICYVDGVLKTLSYNATPPASLSSAANLGSIMIGREIANGYSDGIIDDVRIYNRALASADVAALAAM